MGPRTAYSIAFKLGLMSSRLSTLLCGVVVTDATGGDAIIVKRDCDEAQQAKIDFSLSFSNVFKIN